MNTCGACQKWDVSRPIAPGFGHCIGRSEPWRSAVSTAAHVECRIGLFVAKPQAPDETPADDFSTEIP